MQYIHSTVKYYLGKKSYGGISFVAHQLVKLSWSHKS